MGGSQGEECSWVWTARSITNRACRGVRWTGVKRSWKLLESGLGMIIIVGLLCASPRKNVVEAKYLLCLPLSSLNTSSCDA